MKTEKIIAAWFGFTLIFLNCLPQITHQGIKIGIICAMDALAVVVFGWSIYKGKRNNGN